MIGKSSRQQKAGDNSSQTQIDKLILKTGIDEKRVREIVDEKLQLALHDFTSEAVSVAERRSEVFGEKLIGKMVKANALSAFSDPSFQILLVEAQKRAASTEREPDYDLLSELMLHRFKKGTSRNARAGISRAVEVVDQITDEALLGLTILHAVTSFHPVSGKISEGLTVLDDLFSKLIYASLPSGKEWLDHLDILDAVRLSSFGNMKKLGDFWYELFEGYVSMGVAKDSDDHARVKEILSLAKLSERCLVESTRDKGMLKLELLHKDSIDRLSTNSAEGSRKLLSEEVAALKDVYDICAKTKMSKEDFLQELDRHDSLRRLRQWWDNLEPAIQITTVGKVLAHSNSQRIDSSLPSLD